MESWVKIVNLIWRIYSMTLKSWTHQRKTKRCGLLLEIQYISTNSTIIFSREIYNLMSSIKMGGSKFSPISCKWWSTQFGSSCYSSISSLDFWSQSLLVYYYSWSHIRCFNRLYMFVSFSMKKKRRIWTMFTITWLIFCCLILYCC